MTPGRTTVTILCIVLLLFARPATATGAENAVDEKSMLRASTVAEGNLLVQVAADSAADQSGWLGLVVLLFGGLLSGTFIAVTLISLFSAVSERGERAGTDDLHSRRKDPLPPADGF